MKHRALAPFVVAALVAFAAPAPASVGSEATDFSLPAAPGHTFRGRFRMADHLRRRPVVMLFWATWCQPCLQELPIYQALSQRYGNQITVVGVSMDGPDTVAEAGATARRMGITFPIVTDLETQVVTVYNPRRAAPFSVWINRQGIITREREGFSMAEVPQIQSGIAELVAPPRRPGAPVAPAPGAPTRWGDLARTGCADPDRRSAMPLIRPRKSSPRSTINFVAARGCFY